MKKRIRLIVFLLLVSLAREAWGAVQYTVIDLGTFGGATSIANAINNSGQVVGGAYTSGNAALHAFLHSGSCPLNPSTDDIGTLGGGHAEAWGIEQQRAGRRGCRNHRLCLARLSLQWRFHARPRHVRWNHQCRQLHRQQRAGRGAGLFQRRCHRTRLPAHWRRLPQPRYRRPRHFRRNGGFTYGINENGQVVGGAATSGDAAYHAFLHRGSGPLNPATDDLGTFGGSLSTPLASTTTGRPWGLPVPAAMPNTTPSRTVVAVPSIPLWTTSAHWAELTVTLIASTTSGWSWGFLPLAAMPTNTHSYTTATAL